MRELLVVCGPCEGQRIALPEEHNRCALLPPPRPGGFAQLDGRGGVHKVYEIARTGQETLFFLAPADVDEKVAIDAGFKAFGLRVTQ